MKMLKIDKTDWARGLEALKASYQVIAPVREQQSHEFKKLATDELPDMIFQNTRLSPKSAIYPQSETMFTYRLDENDPDHGIIKEIPKTYAPKAVIGIRPCDAASFLLVKRNFDTPDIKDPYWIRSYESATFVGLACHTPCSSCFCTTAGSGPFQDEGLDVLLVDDGDAYLAKVLTPKGEDLIAAAGWQESIDADAAEQKIDLMKQAAESKITSSVHTDRLTSKNTNDLFDAPFWDDVAFACINCGTCTYSCPTCWCFDIQDEVQGKSGIRMRNWDSCMYPLFTLHGSGHNPRDQKVQRVRQRFMHKLKYYVDKYDSGIQCVGCGRCIRLCPVNIDIRKVCDLMNSY
jgi:ferredoxin